MLSVENLASIESEGRRLALTARREPDRPVPQYPGWTLADLVSHVASIHGRTKQVVEELPGERISAPRLPEGADAIDWYEETLEEMLAVLRDADPTAPCWGFWPESSVGLWESRMVVETGVHRWDAYQAFGEQDRLTDHVALSGLEEFPVLWLPRLGEVQPRGLTATDLGKSWLFGGEEASSSVEATASDIYLRLMSRPSPVDLPEDWAAAVDGLEPPPKR
jgi:uncharacterized protein (TIGR03083 family)